MSKRNQTPKSKIASSQENKAKAAKTAARFAITMLSNDHVLTPQRAREAAAMHKSALSLQRREHRARQLERSQEIADRAVRRRFLQRERELERGIRAYWAVLKTKVRGSVARAGRAKKKTNRTLFTRIRGFAKLVSYSGPVTDSKGRRGVFMRVEYFGARRSRFGVGRRLVVYITRDMAVERGLDGNPVILSNVGANPEEQAAAFELVEVLNRAARGNGKLVLSMIVNLPSDLPLEARRTIVDRFCQEAFGAFDLPYCAALHEPSADGDKRNHHAHILFAFRPLRRTGDHQWEARRELLTEHDTKERFGELRKLFAEVMTEVAQEHGKERREYTHLSNAARGLKNEPQEHLGPALTASVRRGETVEKNERNADRVADGEQLMQGDRARRRRSSIKARVNALMRGASALIERLQPPGDTQAHSWAALPSLPSTQPEATMSAIEPPVMCARQVVEPPVSSPTAWPLPAPWLLLAQTVSAALPRPAEPAPVPAIVVPPPPLLRSIEQSSCELPAPAIGPKKVSAVAPLPQPLSCVPCVAMRERTLDLLRLWREDQDRKAELAKRKRGPTVPPIDLGLSR